MAKQQAHAASPRTTTVPVTTMEEVPVPSNAERAAFLASLRKAEAEIAACKVTEFAPGQFEAWLRERVTEARRKKPHGS